MLKLSVVTFACVTLVGCADAPHYNHFGAIESPVRESFGEDNLERQPTACACKATITPRSNSG